MGLRECLRNSGQQVQGVPPANPDVTRVCYKNSVGNGSSPQKPRTTNSPADLMDREDTVNHTVAQGSWHSNPSGGIAGLQVEAQGPAKDAIQIREHFNKYLNSDISVPWQKEMALLHLRQ